MVLPRVLDRVLAMAIGCLALAPPAPVVASAPGGGLPAAAAPAPAAASAPSSAPAPVTAAEPGPASAPRFGEEIAVRLVTVVVRVVDGAGDPVLGLTPADLRVRVGRREVPVPFVARFLRAVDVEHGRIELDLPPGLIEACASRS